MRQADEMTHDSSWPVGGSRLRPTLPTNVSWNGIGHVPADWESAPREVPVEDEDWERMLATALGISASAPPPFADSVETSPSPASALDVESPPDDVAPAFGLESPVDVQPSFYGEPSVDAEPVVATAPVPVAIRPWSGDDILPHSRSGQKRRRFFRR